MLEIDLPWPPSVNTYWRMFQNRMLISKRGREYRKAVDNAIGSERIEGRLSVRIEAYPPDRRRRDLDNLLKGILDSLEAAKVFDDDEQIDDLRIMRMPVEPKGRVVVLIFKIGGDDEHS